MLIDVDLSAGNPAYAGDSITSLKGKLDKALHESQGGLVDHKIRAVTKLRNGGILME